MMRLLVADDEQYVRTTFTEEIPWGQYGIMLEGVAVDGKEAYDMSLRLKPDVLLTDIRMPHMNGLELTKALRKELPQLKVILLSGWSDFEYAREALKAGASNYLVKPCPDEEIIDALLVVMEELGFERKPGRTSSQGQSAEDGGTVQAKRHAIRLACDLIHQDLSKAVTLTEVAAKISMNASSFSRLFRQEMNCSFSEFVTSARMNMAKKLLVESNMKIQDIAQQVGYVSVSHFVQVFGDYTGMTPGTFREING